MPYQFSKLSVLVVESNNAMFDLTKGVLSSFGVGQIISAYRADQGFQQFCEYDPDLVIVDWLSENPNGADLTKMIRTSPKSPNPFVPIIMMTGYSQKRRVMIARDSGITEFVVKPFTAATLYQKIEAIIEKPRDFVKSPDFFGPDGRRKSSNFTGVDRRKSGAKKPQGSSGRASEIAREIANRKREDR